MPEQTTAPPLDLDAIRAEYSDAGSQTTHLSGAAAIWFRRYMNAVGTLLMVIDAPPTVPIPDTRRGLEDEVRKLRRLVKKQARQLDDLTAARERVAMMLPVGFACGTVEEDIAAYLKQQTARADAAEAEVARLLEQP